MGILPGGNVKIAPKTRRKDETMRIFAVFLAVILCGKNKVKNQNRGKRLELNFYGKISPF